MSKRISPETPVLAYFRDSPLPVAEAILNICTQTVHERRKGDGGTRQPNAPATPPANGSGKRSPGRPPKAAASASAPSPSPVAPAKPDLSEASAISILSADSVGSA
jgi:hypothetical protein